MVANEEKGKIFIIDMMVEYTVIRMTRCVKSVTVKNNGEVVVTCSFGTSLQDIERLLTKEGKRIKKQLTVCKELVHINSRDRVSGEEIIFFGIKKTFLICYNKKNDVVMLGDSIIVWINDIADIQKANLLFDVFCKKILKTLVQSYYDMYITAEPFLDQYELEYKYSKRWLGLCHYVKKTIFINTDMYALPESLIEYVVLHELMHLVVPNHSSDFYDAGKRRMADFVERNKRLKMFVFINL